MEHPGTANFPVATFWRGWRRWAAWGLFVLVTMLLGTVRVATDAELAFASLALPPVLAMAWIGGRRDGLLAAFLAAAMWSVGDMTAGLQFSAPWIPWANTVIRLVTYSLMAVLAAQVRLQLAREHALATQDFLTGLANRSAFLAAGANEVGRSQRYGHSLAVIFLDLDDFKQLNDTKGHAAGDAALQATARALLSAMRHTDRVARLGGDEFAILLPETGHDAAIEAGKKLLAAIERALVPFPPVAASVGVAWFQEANRPFPAMLKAADELMYSVKQSGKGVMQARAFLPTGRGKTSE